MKRERISLLAGFAPALSMAILMGFEYLTGHGWLRGGTAAAAAAEAAAFLLPFGLLLLLRRLSPGKERPPLRLGMPLPRSRSFVFFLSLATPIGAFLLGCVIRAALGQGPGAQTGLLLSLEASDLPVALLAGALLPAAAEELFFRSGLQGCMESAGTGAAVLFSAVSFALVHGSASSLPGSLLAGAVFGYLCYATGSVWPAVFGHMVSNLYALALSYFAGVFESFGLWDYFILLNVVCLCLCLYFAMHSLEKLIERGKIPRFKKGGAEKLLFSFLSPGFLLLVLLFCLKSFYSAA